jgi:hypothetical protein
MKKILFSAVLIVIGQSATAQWTTSGTSIYNTNTGNVGIGTTTPVTKLQISTGSTNDGLRIYQTGTTATAVGLFNNSLNAHNYALFSTGSGNFEGAGHFGLYDYTAGGYRFFIYGLNGNMGIGTGSAIPTAKLQVVNSTTSASGTFNTGVFEANLYVDGVPTALKATTTNQVGPTQNLSRGVYGIAQTPNLSGNFSSYNYGVHGSATGGHANYGGYFEASGGLPSSSNIGISASGSTWAGYFGGSTYSTGTYQGSDLKLKSDIKPLTNALDKINQLKPSTYNYKTDEYGFMNLPQGTQTGLIAQELELVFPELVKEVKEFNHFDENGKVIATTPSFKSVNYTGLIPVLIGAIQEQQQQINELKALLQSTTANTISSNAVSLSDQNSIVLNQNVPNPFQESTLITYSIPQSFKKAQLIFITGEGRVIKTVDILEAGAGRLTVFANDLSSGTYTYSLVIDGETIDSKRMVKQ